MVLECLRGRFRVLAIKESVDLCPWADAVYGCDGAWWKYRRGLPEFKGLKLCWGGNGVDFPDIVRVEIAREKGPSRYSTEMQFDTVGIIGGGGNSGFQAINLAAQFGADRILLIGFDMTDRSGVHWYGRNHWAGASNPDESNFGRWRGALDRAAPELARRGVRVINGNPNSAITAFPRMALEKAVSELTPSLALKRGASSDAIRPLSCIAGE